MKDLFQNVSVLNENIQHEGCFYVDLCNVYQEVAEHQLE